ncbi:MerC domain-containing protein [Flectobacillus major]|uniref:MerC domain-containing protein n=1 Tax=Flectobacillus major TaxID=103 RepID=UPI0005C683F4|nr:MerC domain-containing protein [Flectobacillus major]
MEKKLNFWYDYLGIFSSAICLVHCLATPIIMFLKAYYQYSQTQVALDEAHDCWDYVFVLLCFIAVFSTTRSCVSIRIVRAFWLAFLAFAVAIIFEDDLPFLQYVGYIASLALIVIHFFNIRFCKKCQIKNFQ